MTLIADRLFDVLLTRFGRREWTANRADPTQVIQYRTRGRRLTMVGSWGIEAKLTVFGRTWRTYDNWLFVGLFDGLEGANARKEMAYEDDPMGRASHYV